MEGPGRVCDHEPRYDGLNDWAWNDWRSGLQGYWYCTFRMGTSEQVLDSLKTLYSSNPPNLKQNDCQVWTHIAKHRGTKDSQMHDSLGDYAH